MSRFVHVAVPVPSLGLLTYHVPGDLPDPPCGSRVLVPLGIRLVTGCVVEVTDLPAEAEHVRTLRDLQDVLDDTPFLPSDVVTLARWVSDYYMCAPGEVIAAAMPPKAWIESERQVQITDTGRQALGTSRGLRRDLLQALVDGRVVRVDRLAARLAHQATRGTRRPAGLHAAVNALERLGFVRAERLVRGTASAFRQKLFATLTTEGREIAEPGRLGRRQAAARQRLADVPDGVEVAELAAEGISPDTLKRLTKRGLVRLFHLRVERDPFEVNPSEGWAVVPPEGRLLTAEQEDALRRLSGFATSGGFKAVLLHGVTGSGKTEVYMRLARAARDASRRALILVPEIALTPVVAAALRQQFGERVAIQHSGLSDGQRHDQWHRIRRGDVDVVVGTRSAVFAPLDRIGLIIVDEEHDTSYKQEEAPRYNGRDVAVMRAKHAGALVVLGSATPSMESFQNAREGRYELISLERRVLDRPLAEVRIVDMREEYAATGPDVILSHALAEAIGERLTRGDQSLVLLNRRGFATAVFCRQCGDTLECPNCSVSLTIHRAEGRARCHYCNHAVSIPKACRRCGAPYLELTGFGTERVERELLARWPSARVARLDRDTSRRRGAIVDLLRRVATHQIDILVGTQMIAKGHDFPLVTLVGVISADVGLGLADFRAAERTFQLLTQVAGRAGRGDARGEAVVQTLYPNHYSIRHACRQDYTAFFEDEIRYRRAMRYPPTVAMVNLVVRARSAGAAMTAGATLARDLRARPASFRVLGPAPAPLLRLRGEYRAQVFLKGRNRRAMREALTVAFEASPDLRRHVTIDVDPLTMI